MKKKSLTLKIDKTIQKIVDIDLTPRNYNDFYPFQLKIDKNSLILSIFNGIAGYCSIFFISVSFLALKLFAIVWCYGWQG